MRQGQRLRAILLPPTAWQPARDSHRPGVDPDPMKVFRALSDSGIDTVLMDPNKWPFNPLAGRGTVLESLDPLRALRVLLMERDADIIVSIFEGAAMPITLLRRLTGSRVPVVLWDLGLTEQWRLRERILDHVVPRVAGVFVLGASQKTYIEQRWGRVAVEVLGHSVDTDFFAPVEPEPGGAILALGDDAGRDFPTFLEAAAGIDASVVIKTARIAPDRAVPQNVTVLRERISHLELRDLYAASRFVVVPLHQTLNASGVSTILEAGAMGKAVVVSDNPAIRDFIVPDETCLVVACGDREAMREAAARLLREPQTCRRLGENARRFVERTSAPRVFADRLARLLRLYGSSGRTDKTTSLDRCRPGTAALNKSGEMAQNVLLRYASMMKSGAE